MFLAKQSSGAYQITMFSAEQSSCAYQINNVLRGATPGPPSSCRTKYSPAGNRLPVVSRPFHHARCTPDEQRIFVNGYCSKSR